jgi:hypothetical protein
MSWLAAALVLPPVLAAARCGIAIVGCSAAAVLMQGQDSSPASFRQRADVSLNLRSLSCIPQHIITSPSLVEDGINATV